MASTYRKGEGPAHFSSKHRMSLETTVVRFLAKYEFRFPCSLWGVGLDFPCGSLPNQIFSDSVVLASSCTGGECCYLHALVHGWKLWKLVHAILLHFTALLLFLEQLVPEKSTQWATGSSWWFWNIHIFLFLKIQTFPLTPEGCGVWVSLTEITKKRYSDFCSIEPKSQLLIPWNFIITGNILGVSVSVLHWVFCGCKMPVGLFLKAIKFNCVL